MRRRTFLSTSAVAGLGAFALGSRTLQAKPGDIPKRTFGKTGERLTIVGQAGGRFPLCTFEEAKAVTLRAYELGINYFDTARIYWDGKSEEVYGAVLPPFRKNIFLTTKSPERSRKGAEADLEMSLRALKTDHVDLWQMHQVSTRTRWSRFSRRAAPSRLSRRRRKRVSAGLLDSRDTMIRRSTWRC